MTDNGGFAPVAPDLPHDALVVVVGGANTDIIGFSDAPLRAEDSNPGHVRTYAGGVGRNVAENLARLGLRVELITAFGDDAASRVLADDCRAAGIALAGALWLDGVPGARYVAINDEHHALAVAINDMRAFDALTPAALADPARRQLIAAADIVVADANLSAAALRALAAAAGGPLVIDPVSAAKAERAAGILGGLGAIKPNALEAEALLGTRPLDLEAAEDAARELVARGVARAFVTPGSLGIGWADAGASGALALPPASVANTIGAGDSFVAGIVYAMLADVDTRDAAMLGAACSAITLASEEVVSPAMSRDAMLATMKELFA